MKWSLCGKSDFVHLVDFSLEKEWEQTFFTSRLINNDSFELPPRTRFPIFILHEKSRIKAACMVSAWGSLFPLFKSIDPPDEKEIKSLMLRLKSTLKRIYSIMGTEERVNQIKPFLKSSKEMPVYYTLMTRREHVDFEYLPQVNDLLIRKATPDDSAALLGLELEYQKEEVFLDPTNIDSSRIYHNLRTSLDDQIVYYASLGPKPIAKAGTNSRGHLWNQIGGVYTDPQYRNKGISTWLMNFTLNELESMNKKTVLFVKENNLAAEKVYNKLGFQKEKRFNITYYI